jgi:superfamily I DNA/RNA helicase
VAATRAKKEVFVTCFGKPSRFLNAALESDNKIADNDEVI